MEIILNKSNRPILRFPNFNDNWIKKRTKNIAPLQRGFDLPTIDVISGAFPVVYSNGIARNHIEFRVEGPGIVTGRSGTIGKVTYVKENFWPHNTSLWVTDFCGNEPKFIYYFYLNFKLDRYNAGSTVPTLNRNDVHFVKKHIPSFKEQQKIANFLTAIDKRIQALEKKKSLLEQYKKGMMQRLFSIDAMHRISFMDNEGTAFPKWKTLQLIDIATRVKVKNQVDNQNVLTISAQLGLVSQLEYFNKSVSAKNLTGYYLLQENDFAYNKSYSNGYPMGAIKRLKKYNYGVVSTLYICFRFNETINNDFMEHYFENGMQNREIEKVAQEGARNHGLLNIGINDFFEIDLNIPCIKEQTKIANFLSAIDKKINLVTEQIELTKTYKKGLLQKMFV